MSFLLLNRAFMGSPFKFLDSYTKEDKDIFFGRDKEIEELYKKVFESKILLVYGVSGTGKTSLLNCGLANKFNNSDWLPINIRRGENINESLSSRISSNALSETKSRSIVKQLQSLYLDHFKPVYLIFDQFEEIFIFASKDEREELLETIKKILDSDIQCKILFVLREEYLANITEFERVIPDFFANRIRIEKMTRQNAKQAIEGPCKAFGIQVEEEFSELLLNKLSPEKSEVELTYLQVFLDKVYRTVVPENVSPESWGSLNLTFNIQLLEALGDVSDLLGSFLEEQISQLESPELGLVILKSFVSIKGTKKQITLEEVSEFTKTMGKKMTLDELRGLVNKYVSLRILREKDESGRYELRHDSLAQKIFEKISLHEKELLEILDLIESRYHDYEKREVYLDEETLDYIKSFEKWLSLSEEQSKFIVASRKEIGLKKERERELLEQKVRELTEETRMQKDRIEEINKDITASIHYANRIQNAMLPTDNEFYEIFPHSFVFLKPRTIVSGDFYWVWRKDDVSVIIVADCTGHGVPGAIISTIGMSILNEIRSNYDNESAGEILNLMKARLITVLKQSEEEIGVKDGMDASVCVINSKLNTLTYAGAYLPIWLIRLKSDNDLKLLHGQSNRVNNRTVETESHVLYEIRPDRMGVGVSINDDPFESVEIDISENDTIYLFTDGYVDQFGGPDGRKFKIKNLKRLLLDIQYLPLSLQKKHLAEKLEEWMDGWPGGMEQIDDVLNVGIGFREKSVEDFVAQGADLLKMASAFIYNRQYSDAEKCLEKAIQMDPGNAELLLEVGNAYKSMGKSEQAIKAMKEAIEIRTDYLEACSDLGAIYEDLKQFEDAIHYYKRCVEINPMNKKWLNMARIFKRREEYSSAIECYERYLAIAPEDNYTLEEFGRLYFEQKDFQRAIGCYEKALKIDPDREETYKILGLQYRRLENHSKSIENYKKYVNADPENIELLIKIADEFEENEDYATAILYYAAVVELDENNIDAFASLGQLYAIQHNKEKADEYFLNTIKLMGDSDEYDQYLIGVCYLFMGDSKKAIEFMLNKIQDDKDEIGNFAILALAYLFDQKFEKAKELLLKYKDEEVQEGLTFKELCVEMLEELEKAHIKHSDKERFLELINTN